MAVLKVNVDFSTLLIGEEGTKTPAGVRGRGDPTGAKRRVIMNETSSLLVTS
ncbi:hypothetical protein ACE198_01670 [Neobacillus sp. KR4-4]|uniref:hypothetical protein n=1 Tax=Neobacillus sp. KR4-4 TaxID=3344872 RepID=UPI0035CA7282